MRNSTIAEGFAQNIGTLTKALAANLSKGVTTGQFDPALNTFETAALIVDLIEGLAMRSVFTGRKVSRAERAALQSIIQKSVRA